MSDKNKKIHNIYTKIDNELWIEAIKDVTPLNKEKKIYLKPIYKNSTNGIIRNNTRITNTYEYTKQLVRERNSNEIDHKLNKKLKQGKIKIDKQLDLHGMTQAQAYDALLSFIPQSYHQRKRCLLIITGKGSYKSQNIKEREQNIGILRQNTPRWLYESPFKKYVLKIEQAAHHHGGEGAIYVLLRKNKT